MIAADPTDTRERLLGHARDVYLEGGPASFSLREVARRSGVSAAAVYRHFDGKEALLAAVASYGFQVFSSYLLRALGERSPRGRLLAAGDHYGAFAVEHPRDYRFIFMTAVEDCGSSKTDALPQGAASPATFQFLVDRVKECIGAKVLAHGDPVHVAAIIWAHVHGLASLRISGHLASVGDDAAFAAFFRASTERLLVGLGP